MIDNSSGTMGSLVAAIRQVCPDQPLGIEENPLAILPIPRSFWARVWAAIRNQPVVEQRQDLGVVRVVLLAKTAPLVELKASVDHVRPAGVRIDFEVIPPITTGAEHLDGARGIAPVCARYTPSSIPGVCDRCGFVQSHHGQGVVYQRLLGETDAELRDRIQAGLSQHTKT